MSCLRSLAGFGFPLFAPAMFNKLGYGKGGTVLACIAIVLGCPSYVWSQFFFYSSNFFLAHSCCGSMVAGYAWVVNTPINHYNIIIIRLKTRFNLNKLRRLSLRLLQQLLVRTITAKRIMMHHPHRAATRGDRQSEMKKKNSLWDERRNILRGTFIFGCDASFMNRQFFFFFYRTSHMIWQKVSLSLVFTTRTRSVFFFM